MREFGIGRSLSRVEDARLVQGRGRYTDDIQPAHAAHMYLLRSPHACANIRSIDAADARQIPGVLAVLTGADAEADGLGTFTTLMRKPGPDGKPNYEPPYRVLAHGRARFVGDLVAAVIATSLSAAKDAAERIFVDYEVLPAAPSLRATMAPNAPMVWDECPRNLCVEMDIGDRAAVDAAFAGAAHVTRREIIISRVTHAPIEPRAAIGEWDQREGRYVLHAGLQGPHQTRAELAYRIFGIPEDRIRVISTDVGGSFGLKGLSNPELALVLWAAKRVGRPVRWTADRSESFMADPHARDNIVATELALDAEGRFLAFRVRSDVNLGAYLAMTGILSSVANIGGIAGVYKIPAIHAEIRDYFSNSSPLAAYRGAGRPEASMMIEQTIDAAARELNIDPAELRLRNLIPSTEMPYNTRFIFTYDSGEFEANQRKAMQLAGWDSFPKRRAAAHDRGRLRGLGMAHVIESAAGIMEEMAEIRFDPAGFVVVSLGTHSQGQGHETTYRQIVAETLGLHPEQVRVASGDSDLLPFGRGTGGSRSAVIAGHALLEASKRIIDQGTKIAAGLLEADARDITFAEGVFAVAGTDRKVSITEVAQASFQLGRVPADVDPGLMTRILTKLQAPTYPNGCHICEVEIDPETGHTAMLGYWVVEDVGRMINPAIVKGQVHGGIVQGLGQALGEQIIYDADGQLQSGSFMDYAMPRASDVSEIKVESNEVHAKTNALGIKGAGEGGTVGALPAIMNAIGDALYQAGVNHFDMPATPYRVWHALQQRREGAIET